MPSDERRDESTSPDDAALLAALRRVKSEPTGRREMIKRGALALAWVAPVVETLAVTSEADAQGMMTGGMMGGGMNMTMGPMFAAPTEPPIL